MLALLHEVTLENDDVLGQRNEMLLFRTSLGILENEFAFAANSSTHLNNAVDFGNFSGVFWTARLKQFGDARQTTGNVFRLGDFSRRLGEQSASTHFLSFFNNDVRAGRDRIVRQHFLFLGHDDDLRMQIFLVLDNDRSHQAGGFIDIALDRDSRDHIAKFNLAGFISQNRHVVRIPLHESFSLLHAGSVGL